MKMSFRFVAAGVLLVGCLAGCDLSPGDVSTPSLGQATRDQMASDCLDLWINTEATQTAMMPGWWRLTRMGFLFRLCSLWVWTGSTGLIFFRITSKCGLLVLMITSCRGAASIHGLSPMRDVLMGHPPNNRPRRRRVDDEDSYLCCLWAEES